LSDRKQLVFTPVEGLPLIQAGDDLVSVILTMSDKCGISIKDGDIYVIAQKIVSKSENRLVNLNDIQAGWKAKRLARRVGKDPRLVELILRESNEVIRAKDGKLIVEHKQGFICANAGIDHSNTRVDQGSEHFVLLLPKDSDASADRIRSGLEKTTGKRLGVLIIDSHGRAWRNGIVGTTIGISGFPALVDRRGQLDLFGFKLRITQVGAADELAAGASLLMGQADEGVPVVHVSGFPYDFRESSLQELIRSKRKDLFR